MAGEKLGGFPYQRRVAQGDGAEDDALKAAREPALDGGNIADAAAELGGDGACFQDGLDRGGIDRLSGEGTV